MTNKLLIEASLFGWDTFFDTANYTGTADIPKLPTGNAVERGWTPLPLPGLTSPGVQLADLSAFTIGTPLDGATITSAAHFYVGDLEGKTTVVLTYRSTDEGPAEFAFQGATLPPNPFGAQYGWDLYYLQHAEASAAALTFAADPANGVEQVLVTGHSLGGIIAELTAARLMGEGEPFAALAPATLVTTMGSPGSTESAGNVQQFNIVHTDDLVAQLSALSPLFIDGGVGREGTDLSVDRPEGALPPFRPGDLDTPEELLVALSDPANGVEHGIALYIDTVALLDSAEAYIPAVSDAPGDLFRWLDVDFNRTIVGSGEAERLVGSGRADLIFAVDGETVIEGKRGSDVLIGGAGDNDIRGGRGADVLVGGPGNDVISGGRGADIIHLFGGTNTVDGGRGRDTAVFDGAFDAFLVSLSRNELVVTQAEDPTASSTLRNIQLLAFDDQTLAFDRGTLTPVDPPAVAMAAATIDDLVITADVA